MAMGNAISNDVFKKSNNLIQALGRQSLMASKVLLMSLLKVEDRDTYPVTADKERYKRYENEMHTDFSRGLVAEFTNQELRDLIGSKSGSYYDKIKVLMDSNPRNTKSLRNNWGVLIPNKETGLLGYTEIITGTLYDSNIGKMYIKFSGEESIKKNIFDLKSNYTLLDKKIMAKFKSIYSYKIYELIKSRIGYDDSINSKNNKTQAEYRYTYTIGQLKFIIGVLDPMANREISTELVISAYPDYNRLAETYIEKVKSEDENVMPRYIEFKKYALDKAKKEITEYTDLELDFKPERNGRGGKVTAVTFIVLKKGLTTEVKRKKLTSDEKDTFLDKLSELIEEPLKIKDLRAIAEASDYDYDKISEKYEISKKTSVENLVGWLIGAIQKDYSAPVRNKEKKQNKFNNFEQRDYNFEELEKNILQ